MSTAPVLRTMTARVFLQLHHNADVDVPQNFILSYYATRSKFSITFGIHSVHSSSSNMSTLARLPAVILICSVLVLALASSQVRAFTDDYGKKQDGLANAKVSARQPLVYRTQFTKSVPI